MENEQVEQVERVERKTNKNLSTSSKYQGLAAAIAVQLMIGFWFGIGAILAIKMVNNLKELTKR